MPNRLTNDASSHRSRVRTRYVKSGGFEAFEPYEVLEMLLFYSIPRKDTKPIAKNLLKTFGSVKAVLNADISTLVKQPGVGMSTAIFLNMLSKLDLFLSAEEAEVIRGSGDLGAYAVKLMKNKTVEEFYAVALSPKNEIVSSRKLATGKISSVAINIRDVINFAFDNETDRIALIHNHTNGMLVPSHDDLQVTRDIIAIAKPLEIAVIDHIITGGDGYISLADIGKLG